MKRPTLPKYHIDTDVALRLLPKWMHALGHMYMEFTADPVVGSVNGYFGEQVKQSFAWLRIFMFSELYVAFASFQQRSCTDMTHE